MNPTSSQSQSPWWQKSSVHYAALASLAALLIFVVFILPQWVEPVKFESASDEAPIVAANKPSDSPWQDAQLARERKKAQEILSEVLQIQDQLERQGVEYWAADEFQQALNTALQADEYYRAREFSEAQQHYQSTLTQLQQLVANTEVALARQLELGQQALDDKDAIAAGEHFTLALTIAPDNPVASAGLASAEVLDQVLALLREGLIQEKTDNWPQALAAYEAAIALDGNAQQPQQSAQALRDKIRQRNFTQAMSAGYRALDAKNYDQAEAHFKAAAAIKPNDNSVALAREQLRNQRSQTNLQQQLAQAAQAEQQERWQDANKSYAAIHARDNSVVEAMVGKLRTDARAQLELRVETVLNNPLQLNQGDNLASAEQTLADVKALGSGGPRLQQQRQALEKLLAQARQPRPVTLTSDNLTKVTIYHVGKLGNFPQHQLMLKPGIYTAVGSRQGFRDVRQKFTVGLDANAVTVDIRCAEKIAFK